MMKRAMLLNGVAILAVLVNHAMGWAYTAMVFWTDVYRNVPVPNYDQEGTLIYYLLLVLWQLPVFAVPAFVFVAGFFFGFTLRGHTRPSRKIVRNRLINLIVPYLIWSLVIIGGRVLEGQRDSTMRYVVRMVSTGVYEGFYFVPLFVQLYLFAFLISPLIVRYPWKILGLAAFVQLGALAVQYVNLVWTTPAVEFLGRMTPWWTPYRKVFWFVLGFLACQRQGDVTRFVERRGRSLLIAATIFSLCVIVGPELLYRLRFVDWRSSSNTFTGTLYATVFILWFLSIKNLPIQVSQQMQRLASHSYGIYLAHGPIMEILARLLRITFPRIFTQQPAFMVLMFLVGLAGPLLLMRAVRRTPLRRAYRFLFG